MAVADGCGLSLALYQASASPNELTLAAATLAEGLTSRRPERLIGGAAYESDALDAALALFGVEMIAPHRRNRKHPTQDRRPFRRCLYFFSALVTASTKAGSSGVTAGSNRAITFPSRSTRNLVKFHLISPPVFRF